MFQRGWVMEAKRVLESCWEIPVLVVELFAIDRRVPRPRSRQPSTRLKTPSPARPPAGRPVIARRRTCSGVAWAPTAELRRGALEAGGSPPGAVPDPPRTPSPAARRPVVAGPNAGGVGAAVARAASSGRARFGSA